MAMTLHLGVVDVPYADKSGTSTGDVAGYLEQRYNVMRHFFELNDEKIAAKLADSLAGQLENLLAGAPAEGVQPYAEAESAIDAEFRQFLALDVLASYGYPGIPTKAALAGENLRLKSKKGAARPSFIASSLYQMSFRSWVE